MKEKVTYCLTAVFIAVIMGGSYIYVSNKREETRRIEQKQTTSIKQKHPNQDDLDQCLEDVEVQRRSTIEKNTEIAKSQGYDSLNSESYDDIQSQYVERKDTCFKRYPLD